MGHFLFKKHILTFVSNFKSIYTLSIDLKNMRYLELLFNNVTVKGQSKIDKILYDNHFYWIIDSEIENAKIEIVNNTIIWHSGNFYSGNWKFGIFKDGTFYGTWENGIWEGGEFKGKWISGLKENS